MRSEWILCALARIFCRSARRSLAAGAQVLGGHVAHIGVATHPRHRGEGLARAVVSAVAFSAKEAGLLPQYQTLHSNKSAMSVGRAVRFPRFATTLSARWGRAAA